MTTSFDSITLAGKSLRPAPFVSTTYEYVRSMDYIIGGSLIVTLSGTIVDANIESKIAELNNLQLNNDCVTLIIGCSGNSDFLDGSGRIRSVDISQGDQPYVANYTIVVAIETIGGSPVIDIDSDFSTAIGVPAEIIPKSLQDYIENITITGSADILSTNDSGMSISKSYLKASGSITLKTFANYLCGRPSGNTTIAEISNFLTSRCTAIIAGVGANNPLINYTSWKKWLDTKTLSVENNSNVVWTFDIYMIDSSAYSPKALIDVNTTDRMDQKTKIKTRNITGSIKGLSLASINDHLAHKANINERITNAETAFNSLSTYLSNGTWPGSSVILTDTRCPDENQNDPTLCPPTASQPPQTCYQRISHNITKSVVNGDISFDMEFADISSCKTNNEYELDITIDDTFPANLIQEIIVPNRQIKSGQTFPRSIIQLIGSSSQSVIITIRATLKSCDKTKMPDLIICAKNRLNTILNTFYPTFGGWIYKRQNEVFGTYSFTITHERIKCDYTII